MSSEDSVAVDHPQYFKSLFSVAGAWYTKTKISHPKLSCGFTLVEPLINPVANALTYYAEPVLTKIDTGVSHIIQVSAGKLESVELTFSERKAFYKASMKAWVSQNHKNFSEFLESLKSNYPSNWKECIEVYALDFYNKSLNYKKPGEMINFAADLLSEGSDNIRGSLQNAWKTTRKAWKKTKLLKITEYYTKLRELVGDLWSDKVKENGEIFLSLSKLKEKIVSNSTFSNDWKAQAKNVAENTSILLLAGADELYFWSKSTFDKNCPRIYATLSLYVPYKIRLENLFNKLSEIDLENIGELTWPEDAKKKIDSVVCKVGFEGYLNKYWEKIDKDEDGVVKVKDLYAVMIFVVSGAYDMAKIKVNRFSGYVKKLRC
ncbi:hypothetical protein SteCoe_21514 [Stentor coeruleus]|uniref:EF-hand domain-containing protein n=1 Tax=Stentor coeruleus TaxID=5963 RepID=A0A1R2BPH2_9CILI|nr:hypothetical protein SteCoe_21514 [Stentor coeruleus]